MLVFQLGDKPCCLLPLMFLRSKWKSIVALISPLQWLVVGMMLFTTQQTWAAGQVLEYGIKRSNDGRYHVYMRPNTAISGENTSLTGQVTIKVPNGTNKFWCRGLLL